MLMNSLMSNTSISPGLEQGEANLLIIFIGCKIKGLCLKQTVKNSYTSKQTPQQRSVAKNHTYTQKGPKQNIEYYRPIAIVIKIICNHSHLSNLLKLLSPHYQFEMEVEFTYTNLIRSM